MKLLKQIDKMIRTMHYVDLIGISLLVLSLVISITGYIRVHAQFDLTLFLNDFYANTSTELGSIAITVIIIDKLARRRDRLEKQEEEFNKTVQKLKSSVNSLALEAMEELWTKGWLTDGSLHGQDLSRADLRGADFGHADLTRVRFSDQRYGEAKFDETTRLPDNTFWKADTDMSKFTDPKHPYYWRGYTLWKTYKQNEDYRNSNLYGANLKHSTLYRVNFSGADMRYSNMQKANLSEANLMNAKLSNALFDENTILPDGKKWTPETDIQRYTDPEHPDFWQPDWANEKSENE